MKVGRQYIVFGNQSLFGHFDWANTGYSHDGVMFQYSTKNFDSYFGWFREADCNIGNGQVAVGGVTTNNCGNTVGVRATTVTAGNSPNGGLASNAANLFIFYNQIKSVPGFLIEPHYICTATICRFVLLATAAGVAALVSTTRACGAPRPPIKSGITSGTGPKCERGTGTRSTKSNTSSAVCPPDLSAARRIAHQRLGNQKLARLYLV